MFREPAASLDVLEYGSRKGDRNIGLSRIEPTTCALRRSDLPWLVAVVLVGGMAGPFLLMLGLARTNAASASLLLSRTSQPWRWLG
jgi:drug/metabolite transporter (DMT)-like permease